MTKEQKQEFTRRITQANSTQLIVILYEMLLLYLEEGAQAHASGDRDAFREAIRKARGCLNELLASLNPTMSRRPLYCGLFVLHQETGLWRGQE